jgi:hypothetical protein
VLLVLLVEPVPGGSLPQSGGKRNLQQPHEFLFHHREHSGENPFTAEGGKALLRNDREKMALFFTAAFATSAVKCR